MLDIFIAKIISTYANSMMNHYIQGDRSHTPNRTATGSLKLEWMGCDRLNL
ncbi:hypothetical protein H6F74_21270 [Trichocoleus sp. FACHB-90]|uniref:hypothetical protein n=1 Tax=Cyanophyceae TaxID=3028117 RepID=UPI00168249F3|nr:hypothetical protein [Trichocoleus sp. FACHB-90]MBD1928760.1 hypothetical protein [Trichocoleus sp. FACHB-90]